MTFKPIMALIVVNNNLNLVCFSQKDIVQCGNMKGKRCLDHMVAVRLRLVFKNI